MWQRGVGCNPCVCQGGILCVPCVDPHSWPELPTWWGGTWSWSSNFCFHISLGGHTQVWLEPGTSASVLSPKERSCGGWRLCCPASLLLCSAWAVKSRSVPSLSALVQAKSSLFLHCSLANKPMFSRASLNGFSSLLPVFHLGLFLPITLPGLLFPACLSQPLGWGALAAPGCLAGLSLGMAIWLLLDASSHPTQPLTFCFLFVFSSSSLSVEFGATSLVTHLLSVSSFLLLFQGSGFIYSVGQAFVFQGDCFSKQQHNSVNVSKSASDFLCFILFEKTRMHKCILRYFKQGGMKVVNWKNKLLLIEPCVRPRNVFVWQTWLTL